MEVGEGGITHLSLHFHHQNDSCIKVGSDESHFNVSMIVREKGHKTVSTDTTFEEKREVTYPCGDNTPSCLVQPLRACIV